MKPALLLFTLSCGLGAQSTAQIQGSIQDATGAAIPAAVGQRVVYIDADSVERYIDERHVPKAGSTEREARSIDQGNANANRRSPQHHHRRGWRICADQSSDRAISAGDQ